MEKKHIEVGVVAKLNGKYWGQQNEFGYMDWGTFQNARISNPEFCTKPTDMTFNPENVGKYREFNELSKPEVELVMAKRVTITTITFEEI